jgi:NADH-quinone oxidoreductase subunit H
MSSAAPSASAASATYAPPLALDCRQLSKVYGQRTVLHQLDLQLAAGEYVAIMTMCALMTILFLGGWLPPFDIPPFNWVPGVVWFVLKMCLVFFMFAMVKAFVPRYRYDQLMRLGWKVFLPTSLVGVFLVAGYKVFQKVYL